MEQRVRAAEQNQQAAALTSHKRVIRPGVMESSADGGESSVPRRSLPRVPRNPLSSGATAAAANSGATTVTDSAAAAAPSLSSSGKKKHQRQEQVSNNPFTKDSCKVHFPGFEVALFGPPSPDNSSSSNPPDHDASPSDPDKSTCSYSSSINNLSVDLSIGARAALDEHRRHVAKYGIDGVGGHHDGYGNGNPGSRRSSFSLRGSPDGGHSPDEWERINDGSTHVSFASTFIVEGGRHDDNDDDDGVHHDDEGHIMLGRSFLSEGSHEKHHGKEEEEEDHEEEGNSDYFNSSRVKLLETPERNKHMVDEASRRTREMALAADGDGAAVSVGHVTGRGQPNDNDDDVFGGSSIGVDDSTVGGGSNSGSTVVGDESGMAFLFREAMRLNADALANEDEGGGDDSGEINDNSEEHCDEKSHSSSFVSFGELPNGTNGSEASLGKVISGSPGESFVECEEGIEFVADLSDILSVAPLAMPQTPSRSKRGGHGSHQKPPMDPFSTPRRGSPRRRMGAPMFQSSEADKENTDAGDFNMIALSPIASRAGAEAAKMLSSGSNRYIGGTGTPVRTPSRRFGTPRKSSNLLSQSGLTPNRNLATTPERTGPIPSLKDSNLSVSVIESNDASIFSEALSPVHSSPGEDIGYRPAASTADFQQMLDSPERRSRSNSVGSPGHNERTVASATKMRSHSVDSPGRRCDFLPKRVVKSLGARYSQPDRFEDDFTPLSPTIELSVHKSVSRSLLESFEA